MAETKIRATLATDHISRKASGQDATRQLLEDHLLLEDHPSRSARLACLVYILVSQSNQIHVDFNWVAQFRGWRPSAHLPIYRGICRSGCQSLLPFQRARYSSTSQPKPNSYESDHGDDDQDRVCNNERSSLRLGSRFGCSRFLQR